MKKLGTFPNYLKGWFMNDLLEFTEEINLDISTINDEEVFKFVNDHINENKELLTIKGYL